MSVPDPVETLPPMIRAWAEEGGAVPMPPLEVRPGEFVVLEGPPGSGKSAILRAARGLEASTPIRVEVDGTELRRARHAARRRILADLRILYLPPEPTLLSNLTILDNLLLPIRFLAERSLAEAEAEARGGLRAVGLEGAEHRRPSRLAPADRRAVSLLRGVLRRPRVAFLDDPLADLARARADRLRPLLRSLTQGGCAVLAASRPGGPYQGLATRTVPLSGTGGADGEETAR